MAFSLLLLVGCSGSSGTPAVLVDMDEGDDAIEASPAAAPEDDVGVFGTFRDVMSWGQSAHCTWDIQVRGVHVVGEVWIDGDRWKQIMTTEGQLLNSVSDGEYMYMWGPSMPGMKIPMNLHEMDEYADVPPAGIPAGPEMDVEYNYDCEPMSIPSSMFVPPNDVEFRDISEMMATMGR